MVNRQPWDIVTVSRAGIVVRPDTIQEALNLEIRAATARDAENISNLVRQLSAKFIANDFTAEGRETLLNSMTPAAIEKYMQSGFRYHVAEVESQLVGVVGVKDNSHLYHLFVAENYQRQGIASALWRLAKQTCLDEGNLGVFTVNSSRYAQHVYERLGFVTQSDPQDKNGVIFIPMKLVTKHAE